MLVYDITDEKSFENIKNWIRNIEENASADVEKMLLGNKCELNDKRQVRKNKRECACVRERGGLDIKRQADALFGCNNQNLAAEKTLKPQIQLT